MSATKHALLVFGLATFTLLLPKMLALVDLARDRARARKFGGWGRAALSAFLELLYSTLQAPILMLWHSQFVISTLLGRAVNWGSQNRGADGTTWSEATRQLWKHTLIGIVWGCAVAWIDPVLLGWFSPVLLGMLLAIPITVWTSRGRAGEGAGKMGLFLTPEETEPTVDVRLLRSALAVARKENASEESAIADPYVHALHIALLERAQSDPTTPAAMQNLSKDQPSLESLREKLLREGLQALTAKEKLLVLSDIPTVRWLYREVWSRKTTALSHQL